MTDIVQNDGPSYEGAQQRTFLGHPIGLGVLFMTEMWERFSYYGMRALLILFLTKHFLYSAGEASLIYGAYTGLVYILPIIGGYFADRYLGSRKAVTYGAILLVLGHLSLAFEGPQAFLEGGAVVRSDLHIGIFYLSLALIVTGVGFLKPNISTIVGTLYGKDDPRRDGGFTIFYVGINIGSLLAILLCGYLGETFGWGYGFGAAGIGMLLGLVVFLGGQSLLEGRADPPSEEALKEKVFAGINREYSIYLIGILLVALSWFMVQSSNIVGWTLNVSTTAMVIAVLAYGWTKCTKVERERLWAATVLIVFQVVFWALFEQQGSSLTLLADQQFDLDLGLFSLKASQVQFMNPGFIILLGPLFAVLWVALAKIKAEPSTTQKFAIAMLLVGLGYVGFAYGLGAEEGNSKSFLWLVLIYFLMTAGELCLSPVGLSMITKLSVPRIVGMMMGMWFLFTSLANFLAGVISSLTGTGGHGAGSDQVDVAATMELFNSAGIVALVVGVVLFALNPLLRRWMHGVH